MEELWKVIGEFPNYSVSTFGNVKNNTTDKILRQNINGGYYSVGLYINFKNNNKCKTKLVHRLVATELIPNIDNKPTVNHKDHNKLNNNITNLEWATMKEQNNHKRKPSREIQQYMGARSINRINITTNEIIEHYKSIKDAALWLYNNNYTKSLKIMSVLSRVLQEKSKTAYGFFWKYDESVENALSNINEEWREIPKEFIDNNEKYYVSNLGKLKSDKGRITYGFVRGNKYLHVTVKNKQYFLHRLVAQTFLKNPENKPFINHIDCDKKNAKLSNLEWTTSSENAQHAHDNGCRSNTKSIVQYDRYMNKIQTFKSMSEAGRQLNIDASSISDYFRNKKRKSVGGFIFKFLDDKIQYNKTANQIGINKKIIQYDLQMNKIASFNSMLEAHQNLNISLYLLRKCCREKLKNTHNFIFKFE